MGKWLPSNAAWSSYYDMSEPRDWKKKKQIKCKLKLKETYTDRVFQ